MTTHIRTLRPYTYKGVTKLGDKSYKNLFCTDINYLFGEGLEKLLHQIPKEDNYNLYYTACTITEKEMTRKDGKKYINKRAFVDQEVIPFDIDHVCLPQIENYYPLISQALGLPLNEMIIVHTGNGLQVIVKSAVKITELSYFKEHVESYKNICSKLQACLNESGLAGDVDTSVWSPGRLLRLPGTENRKPMLTPFADDVNIKNATLTEYRKISGKGLLLERDNPLTKLESKQYDKKTTTDYLRPDVDFIREQCLFVKGCLDGSVDVHEPECYAFLGIAAFLEDDDRTANDGLKIFSSDTIDNMDGTAKIDQARDTQTGPRTCNDISGRSHLCSKCPHYGKVVTPLQIRRPEFNLSLAYSGELGKKPAEIEVVAFVLNQMGIKFDPKRGKVVRANCKILKEGSDLDAFKKDYFHFNGKFWEQLEPEKFMDLEALILKAYNFGASNAKVKATLKALLEKIPFNTGHSFFTHQIDRTNFTNGTLQAIPTGHGTYIPKFEKHNKNDRLTYCLPGEYNDLKIYDHSKDFGKMLDRIYASDEDKQQKINVLKEMFGACLLPMFPRVFFLQGAPGTGKSTVLKLLSYMLGSENIAHVELTGKSDFNLEDIIGYNVNLITDIDENEPIKINVIKQIEDRMPIKISRKFRTSLIAPLPPIHIFGANAMPPLYEKSGALSRRTTVNIFNNSFTKGEEKLDPSKRTSVKEIASLIFEEDRQNIMAFAIEGITRLLNNNGHYTNTDSGIKKTYDWITDKDPIQQFLDAIKNEEIEGIRCRESKDVVLRSSFYDIFGEWILEENGINSSVKVPTRTSFCRALEAKSYSFIRRNNGYFIKGFTSNSQTNF